LCERCAQTPLRFGTFSDFRGAELRPFTTGLSAFHFFFAVAQALDALASPSTGSKPLHGFTLVLSSAPFLRIEWREKTERRIPTDQTTPPLEYLLTTSKMGLESLVLSRLSRISILRKEFREVIEEWVRTEADARVIGWILDSRRAQEACGTKTGSEPVHLNLPAPSSEQLIADAKAAVQTVVRSGSSSSELRNLQRSLELPFPCALETPTQTFQPHGGSVAASDPSKGPEPDVSFTEINDEESPGLVHDRSKALATLNWFENVSRNIHSALGREQGLLATPAAEHPHIEDKADRESAQDKPKDIALAWSDLFSPRTFSGITSASNLRLMTKKPMKKATEKESAMRYKRRGAPQGSVARRNAFGSAFGLRKSEPSKGNRGKAAGRSRRAEADPVPAVAPALQPRTIALRVAAPKVPFGNDAAAANASRGNERVREILGPQRKVLLRSSVSGSFAAPIRAPIRKASGARTSRTRLQSI
jgi:hypothetical protein